MTSTFLREEKMKTWFGCLVAGMILFVPGLSQAENGEAARGARSTIEDVVVTASRVEEQVTDLTSDITVIDEQEIEMSAATDIGDLLVEKGIGHIQKYPGLSTSIGIRGFRTDTTGNDLAGKVLILLNGRRAGTGDLSKIATDNVERVEIIRGPASVQYGSAAMGGVVNVITKTGSGAPAFFVEGDLGSYGRRSGTAGFSGKQGSLDFSGGFTRESLDDYETADGKDYDNTGYDRKDSAGLNLGFEFLPENHLRLIYNYFAADDVGSPGYLSQVDPDAFTDVGLDSVDLIYDGRTRNGFLSWQARYFSGRDKYKWTDPTWASVYKKDTDHRGAQGQVSVNWENSTMTTGFDWVNYEIDSNASPARSEYDNPACFILAKTRLHDRLVLSGGLRYDAYEVDMKNDGGKEDDDNLSTNLGAAYNVTDYLKVRANYGQAFKMPTAEQLAGDYVAWISYLGNPALDPEKSNTYECGFDLTYAAAGFSATYFYTDFEDKIQVYTLPTAEQSYRNLGGATIAGLESEVSLDLGALRGWDFELRPYGSIVYLTKYEDDETGDDLLYTEDINAAWGLRFSDLNGLSAGLNFVYTGKKSVEDWENWSDPVTVVKKGGFTVADLTVSKRILDLKEHGRVTLKAAVTNLFDREYEYISGYPMPGRTFLVGLRYGY
jgi:vitamin B12 transporter